MSEAASSLFDLTGKAALVTGASRGLGRAMALALARAGCDVALNARSAQPLEAVSQEIRGLGRKTLIVAGDVSQEQRVKEIVEAAQKAFGRIDVLVNNAGIWRGSYLVRLSLEDWQEMLRVNMTGAFLMSQAVAKVMLKQRSGKIINLSSIQAMRGAPQSMAYAATKAAILQMTRIAAIEMGPAGIQVNAIAPGFFDTDMTRQYQEDKEKKEMLDAYVARIPLRRYGQPEDLSGLVVFLASKGSDHITGQTIVIDGGESLA